MYLRVARFQTLYTPGAGFHLIPEWMQRFHICGGIGH
jgi:hypothetical protein